MKRRGFFKSLLGAVSMPFVKPSLEDEGHAYIPNDLPLDADTYKGINRAKNPWWTSRRAVAWPDGSTVFYDTKKSLEEQFGGEYLDIARRMKL